jgi:thiosulfate/3-mercaptopyruvate sulfurtransferase
MRQAMTLDRGTSGQAGAGRDRRSWRFWKLALWALAVAAAGCPTRMASRSSGSGWAPPPGWPLVSAGWLRANLGAPGLVVLDVSPLESYRAGHIPGSRHCFSLECFSRSRGPILDEVQTDPALVERHLRQVGVHTGDRIVLVWQGREPKLLYHAARAFLTLSGFGLPCGILDGGLEAWRREGHPVTREEVRFAPGKIRLPEFRATALASPSEILGATQLIDTRPPPYFRGERRKPFVARAGTLPGARNLPFVTLLTPDGRFRPRPEMARIFEEHGVRPQAILFCDTGGTSAIVWLAAALVGLPTRVYDGSMSEWALDPRRPMYKAWTGKPLVQ